MSLFNGNGKKAPASELRPWEAEFTILDEMPETNLPISEDKDVSRMREATSPKDFRMVGVVDRTLTDDFASLFAIAQALDGDKADGAGEPLAAYVENYYRMTASENGRGRSDMVSVGRTTAPLGDPKKSLFRWGQPPGGGNP